VDFTFGKNLIDYFSKIPKALLDEKNADILLFYFFTPSERLQQMMRQMGVPPDQIAAQAANLVDAYSESIMRLFENHDKPFVGYTFQNLKDPLLRILIERGIPIFPGPQRAARAIEAAHRYTCLRGKILAAVSQEAVAGQS
jgi:acetyl-CoA synthetase (ADP-forming)